ncbi:MAG: YidC/Oxa1 family membrane protein insertase [Actinomycetota bacterium]|nr:YidC/Oxa1 family membrane protein insertase [Actinomycetota bacterium]
MPAVIPPFSWFVAIFEPVLVFFHGLVGSWGLAIILLVVAVRIVLVPLTLKQMRSMQAMAHLAPEMKEIQRKYKDDRQRQQQEMMQLYKENKVNPASSCLPLLAQIPVFIALFYLLQDELKRDICGPALGGRDPADITCGAIDPGSAEFLFIADLTDKAGGWVLALLIFLYIGSQLVASLVSLTTADKMQRRLFLALPFVFVLFIINFPAGLIVYWITTNIWTAGQGYLIRRKIGPIAPPKPEGEESTSFRDMIQKMMGADEPAGRPAPATAGAGGGAKRNPSGPPPPPPRKKKKRSGRRR